MKMKKLGPKRCKIYTTDDGRRGGEVRKSLFLHPISTQNFYTETVVIP